MYKFTCFIWFHSLISFKVPHIQKCNKFNILILFTLYLIQQFHIFNSLTNSVLLSNFSFTSHSTVPHIQKCNKVNGLISFYILIYFNSKQIHKFYLIQQTNFIQQPHIFNRFTNSVVLSNFSFMSHSIVPHIQPCNKFNCFTPFYILIYFKSVQIYLFYLIPQSNFIQQSHIFKSATNSIF